MTAITELVDLSLHGEVAVLRVDNPPVNALSRGVRDGLLEGVKRADADPNVRGILIYCSGNTYIAGADIREFGKRPEGASLQGVHDAIESASKPVVSAIHGTALGGGLETALACHYRVAVSSARFGLPEVKLGILPGAGGTQRLPRVVGVQKALEMMTSGEQVDSRFALDHGLIDGLVDDLLQGGLEFTQRVIAEKRPLKKVRDQNDKLAAARADPSVFARMRASLARSARGFEAPEAIVQCVEAAVQLADFDAGLAAERERFIKLLTGPQSAAQRGYFFAERQASKLPDVPADTAKLPIAKVGVLGAGTMGGGIAMNFLNAGIPVRIVEVNPQALERGVATIRKNYERSAQKGKLSAAELDARMALLTPSLDMNDFADCDLIIEAVFESMPLKKEIFGKLDLIARPGAILASNTSALDLNEIASATRRPGSVIGLHFFSPANVMKLLEVVRGAATDKSVLATAMALAKRIGKIAVVSGVCPGFIGNRMLFQRGEQARRMIFEGPMPWDVDRVLYDFGFPMGPFAMSDLAGLDIGWDASKSKGESLRDRLCELGRKGQKAGAGYYNYDPATREKSPEPRVEALILELSEKQGKQRRAFSDEEILERLLYPMINEGAKILEEGIAYRASDIDVVWVNGYGFPVYRGGPMYLADQIGLAKVVARLEQFRAQDGDEFWRPAALLQKLAAEGKRFAEVNQ
jgi:3-hydroxyacyl-CoA dehydrogenase